MAKINVSADAFCRELRKLKTMKSVDFKGLLSGIPESYILFYKNLFIENNIVVSKYLVDKGFELSELSDYKFMESIYKMMRELFNIKPPINQNQFFSQGFVQRKLEMSAALVSKVRQIIAEVDSGKFGSGRSYVQTQGLMREAVRRKKTPNFHEVTDLGDDKVSSKSQPVPQKCIKPINNNRSSSAKGRPRSGMGNVRMSKGSVKQKGGQTDDSATSTERSDNYGDSVLSDNQKDKSTVLDSHNYSSYINYNNYQDNADNHWTYLPNNNLVNKTNNENIDDKLSAYSKSSPTFVSDYTKGVSGQDSNATSFDHHNCRYHLEPKQSKLTSSQNHNPNNHMLEMKPRSYYWSGNAAGDPVQEPRYDYNYSDKFLQQHQQHNLSPYQQPPLQEKQQQQQQQQLQQQQINASLDKIVDNIDRLVSRLNVLENRMQSIETKLGGENLQAGYRKPQYFLHNDDKLNSYSFTQSNVNDKPSGANQSYLSYTTYDPHKPRYGGHVTSYSDDNKDNSYGLRNDVALSKPWSSVLPYSTANTGSVKVDCTSYSSKKNDPVEYSGKIKKVIGDFERGDRPNGYTESVAVEEGDDLSHLNQIHNTNNHHNEQQYQQYQQYLQQPIGKYADDSESQQKEVNSTVTVTTLHQPLTKYSAPVLINTDCGGYRGIPPTYPPYSSKKVGSGVGKTELKKSESDDRELVMGNINAQSDRIADMLTNTQKLLRLSDEEL